jgi:hypothetical protein
LQSKIEGDGEPGKRIDRFQMRRKGEPNPCTFVSTPGTFSSKYVVQVIDVKGKEQSDLDESWRTAFNHDLNDGSWCNIKSSPLWKVELHRLRGAANSPCALLISFNHAISDQSSANRLTEQIVALMEEINPVQGVYRV